MGYKIKVCPKMDEPLDNVMVDVIVTTVYHFGRRDVKFRKADGGVEFTVYEPLPDEYVNYMLGKYYFFVNRVSME